MKGPKTRSNSWQIFDDQWLRRISRWSVYGQFGMCLEFRCEDQNGSWKKKITPWEMRIWLMYSFWIINKISFHFIIHLTASFCIPGQTQDVIYLTLGYLPDRISHFQLNDFLPWPRESVSAPFMAHITKLRNNFPKLWPQKTSQITPRWHNDKMGKCVWSFAATSIRWHFLINTNRRRRSKFADISRRLPNFELMSFESGKSDTAVENMQSTPEKKVYG